MRYISTRGMAAAQGFGDVLLAGLAGDGGLWVPETWPRLDRSAIAALAGRPYHEVATEVVAHFTGAAVARQDLAEMAEQAYRSFGHPAVTPLVQIGPGLWVLELFHGPTLAFKDVAMQLLARLVDHGLARLRRRATIVCATSGDTGGAAIEAFRASARADLFVLYPAGRISEVQRRMMTTPAESHVHSVAIEGTFDDCQALVKAMFNHAAFRQRLGLLGVNSINWARIAAQVPYYFAAAVALGAPWRPVSFVVPTGNFGNVFAGYAARRMGLPIDRLVIATNSNDILARVVASGIYEKRGVAATTSPSMDIEVSSNFERYLFEAEARDTALVRFQMAMLAQGGRFEVRGGPTLLAADFEAAAATEFEVAQTIARIRAEAGYLTDPHTACALVAAEKVRGKGGSPMVVLATAHPAKFPEAVAAAAGVRPRLPERLAATMDEPERIVSLANDLAAVERFIEQHARAGAEQTA